MEMSDCTWQHQKYVRNLSGNAQANLKGIMFWQKIDWSIAYQLYQKVKMFFVEFHRRKNV